MATTATGIGVRDTVLWVEDTGEADLPAILCLHSLWLDHTMFDELVARVAGRYRAIRPDFRGQGRSAPPTTECIDMDTCAEDMIVLLDRLEVRPVGLVAQSMGGDVAIRMAARRPDLFRSMVLLASSARGGEIDELGWVKRWLDDAFEVGFVGDGLQRLREVMFGATTRRTIAQQPMLRRWTSMLEATPRSLWPAIRGVIYREDAGHLLSGIATPTLVFAGEEDVARPPSWAEEVVAGLPDAGLVLLPGIGHSPILEAPDMVIPQIISFLDRPRSRNPGSSDAR